MSISVETLALAKKYTRESITSAIVNKDFSDIELLTKEETIDKINDSVGKVLNLGFDGVLENNILTFSSEYVYNIKEGYNVEIDLNFPAVGILDDNVEMVISNNGEIIKFITPTHRTTSTNATVGDMKQAMRYNETSGFRWIFNAICHITSSNVKAFLIVPTIINLAEQNNSILNVITNDEMMDIETDSSTLYRGRKVSIGDLFICGDDNGYNIGHIYKYTGEIGNEWEDIIYSNFTNISGYSNNGTLVLKCINGTLQWIEE